MVLVLVYMILLFCTFVILLQICFSSGCSGYVIAHISDAYRLSSTNLFVYL